MRVLILPSKEKAEAATAKRLVQMVQSKSDAVLGLATGGTMEPVYQEMISQSRDANLSYKNVRSFNLDEYIGLSQDHPQSYYQTMQKLLFSHLDFDSENTFVPRGDAADPNLEAKEYDEKIKAVGGVDLQLLGVGENGHIGFNEPTSSLGSRTRIKHLTRSTIDANRRFFKADEAVPTHSITMGIATILEARKVVMLATGEKKAKAVLDLVEGPVSAFCPASALQFHPDVDIILDPESASRLQLKDYYQDTHPDGEERYFSN